MTDSELLYDYCRNASQEAFREIVRRHLPLVFGSARRKLAGNGHRAQDVAQTVFIDLARKAPRLCGRRTLAGWLYLATHHAAAELMRSEERRERREQEASHMQTLSQDFPPDWSRVAPGLDRAIRGLRDSDRDAIVLRFHEGRSFSQIGETLGLKEDTARHRVDRALERLRSKLRSSGITSTASALALALGQESAALGTTLASTLTATAIASQATAAASGPSVSGTVLFLMSTSKIALTLTGAALALLVFSAVRSLRSERQDAAALARTAAEVNALRARLQLTLKVEAITHPASVVLPTDASFQPAPPELQAVHRRATYGFFNREYARFFQHHDFTPAQVEAFDAAINPDPRIALSHDSRNRGMIRLLPDGYDGQDARLQALLGADYASYSAFQRSEVNYGLAATTAAEALQAGSPMDSTQVTALAQALVQADRGRTNHIAGTPDTYDWDAVQLQLGSNLTAAQGSSVAAVRIESQYKQQLADERYPAERIDASKP